MRVCLIVGTRPEIIKMTPVIRECESRGLPFFLIHTNQHYSREMDALFFEELGLSQPAYALQVGSGTHGEITGKALIGIEKILSTERPSMVLVQGDTNSALAGALAAVKLHIPVGHIEAGLRSYFRGMPEEINRVLIDHTADVLFAPTPLARTILIQEGISNEKVFLTGNTIVDALRHFEKIAKERSLILARLNLVPKGYILVTAHREENVDSLERLTGLMRGLLLVASHVGIPLIYPVHPRTRKRMEEFRLVPPEGVRMIDPIGFFDFLTLETHAKLSITDSGGVQEESCVLGVPCVTMRDNTERPETVEMGANVLAGSDPQTILEKSIAMIRDERHWIQPFGDGTAAKKIISIIGQQLGLSTASTSQGMI